MSSDHVLVKLRKVEKKQEAVYCSCSLWKAKEMGKALEGGQQREWALAPARRERGYPE